VHSPWLSTYRSPVGTAAGWRASSPRLGQVSYGPCRGPGDSRRLNIRCPRRRRANPSLPALRATSRGRGRDPTGSIPNGIRRLASPHRPVVRGRRAGGLALLGGAASPSGLGRTGGPFLPGDSPGCRRPTCAALTGQPQEPEFPLLSVSSVALSTSPCPARPPAPPQARSCCSTSSSIRWEGPWLGP
jgi:hypothetical protein